MSPKVKKGLTVYRYEPETGAMQLVGTQYTEMNVGNQSFCRENGLVYATDEFWSQLGRLGGGGNVAALRLDPLDGTLERVSFRRTYATNPTYQCMDPERNFLLVTHHGTEHFVTRLIQTPDGGYDTETLYDDCLLLLMELQPDGSIGAVCHVVNVPGVDEVGGHRFPHLHCVVPDHTGRYYLVTDKGLDKIYLYTIDTKAKRLVKMSEIDSRPGAEPRYGVFHPQKQIFYANFEHDLSICAYALDTEAGVLREIGTTPIVPAGTYGEEPMIGDIAMHPSGRFLYTTIRTPNLISMIALGEGGEMTLRQTISCGGENPRGICIAPDGRFLFVANSNTGTIDGFAIGEDGMLTGIGTVAQGGVPGNLQIITFEPK
jgi:6-phosphogluconolactonase (cycloisomerase 2 family)